MEFFATGKQWMWKIQHPSGVREINELHVPANRAIRMTLGSEDVIHDFSIPAMRVKMDVVPGKLTTLWFEPTVVGTYHIFCAEYCGTRHSGMIGQVTVMTPEDYQAWLGGGSTNASPAALGEKHFNELGCASCHKGDGKGLGPNLAGVFGSTVELGDGRKVVADENYLRESIVNPQAKVVKGYPNPTLMPVTFAATMSEEQLMQVIAYLKTLKGAAAQ
jgi:cytochrome c oxidase subunit 2